MISVVIPAYNEAGCIERTIQVLRRCDAARLVTEIIVSDGGSVDDTAAIAVGAGARVIHSNKGRARQMNRGAAMAKAGMLYFLHADSIVPEGFSEQIVKACQKGSTSGCFRLRFDHDHWFLKANAWFTRFNVNGVRFGDQSLFVTKEVFEQAGGFRENLLMMEDQEIIHRLKKHGRFEVLKGCVTTSARKYLDNGIYRMQGIFFLLWTMYYLGYTQEQMLRVHQKYIRKHKL